MENKTLKELNQEVQQSGVLNTSKSIYDLLSYSSIPISKIAHSQDFLQHYNHNHDALGRFTSGVGGAVSKVSSKITNRKSKSKSKSKNEDKTSASSVSKKDTKKSKPSKKQTRSQKSRADKAKYEKEEKTARQRKESLDKVIRSGDANEIYARKSEMSTQQLRSAIDRINTERQLSALVNAQKPSTLTKIKTLTDKTGDVNTIIRSGIDTYRTVNDVRKIMKNAKDAKSKAEKAEASAAVLKEIIDSGATAADITRLQSRLSDNDLRSLKDRTMNLDQIGKIERSDAKRAKDQAQARTKNVKEALNAYNKAKAKQDEDFGSIDLSPMPENGSYDKYIDDLTITRLKDVNKKQRKNRE